MQAISSQSYLNSCPSQSASTRDSLGKIPSQISFSVPTSGKPAKPLESTCTTCTSKFFSSEKNPGISSTISSSMIPTKPHVSKRVSFNPKIFGKYFTATSKDLQDAWYSPEDFRTFEENAKANVNLLRRIRKNPVDSLFPNEILALEETPSRGIEQYLSKRKCYDRTNKQRALIQTVLAKQQCHRAQGSQPFSPGVLAMVSSAHSLEARRRALECGIRDEEAAAKVYMNQM